MLKKDATIEYTVLDFFNLDRDYPRFPTYEAARAFIKSLGRKWNYLRVATTDCFINNPTTHNPVVHPEPKAVQPKFSTPKLRKAHAVHSF